MKRQVHPAIAMVVILGVIMLAGYAIWKLNEDKPIPEGPGSGRIGLTYHLPARPGHKSGSEEKSKAPAKPDEKNTKPGP